MSGYQSFLIPLGVVWGLSVVPYIFTLPDDYTFTAITSSDQLRGKRASYAAAITGAGYYFYGTAGALGAAVGYATTVVAAMLLMLVGTALSGRVI